MRTAPLFALLLAAAPATAEPTPNPIHPLIAPFDGAGKRAGSSEDVSSEATCGVCHDIRFIDAHSEHVRAGAQATCIGCHVEQGRLDVSRLEGGKLRREDLLISRPRAAHCAACHGIVSDGSEPVQVPADFEAVAQPGTRTWSLTAGEGAVVAPDPMSESFLNLEGKAGLAAPWDVHSAKLVDCVSCHYAANDPRRTDLKRSALRYVVTDPRRTSTADFLLRPDHRLAKPDCRSCHAPLETHAFLPYKERHMQVLACQACHVPGPEGPTLKTVDATVATAAGTPAYTYRNVEPRAGESLNAALIRPLRPLLSMRTGADGVRRLAPVNVVSRWRWVTAADRAEVPFALVDKAYREGGRWAPEVLKALDADGDGTLSSAELRLDTQAKVDVVASRLSALGVVRPEIDGVMEPHAIAHGIAGRKQALRDCSACHGEQSRLGGAYPLASYVPGGRPPRPPEGGKVELAGMVVPGPGGQLELRIDGQALPSDLHVLGRSRQAATNLLGFALFLAVFGGVALHGGARLLIHVRSRRPRETRQLKAVYAFGRYERLWHWTMAASGIGLIATGLVIHKGDWHWPIELATAVSVHNALAVVLMVNAFLSLFYHLATAAIRSFVPQPRGLLARVLEHLEYQTRGIFRGGPHPSEPAGQKLNPLQQMAYLALLNLLFPLQMATGVLIWTVGHWPSVGAALGGLSVIAPIHNLGAWLFVSFFVLHVYLVTTGRTLGGHLRAMTTGYQLVEPEQRSSKGA